MCWRTCKNSAQVMSLQVIKLSISCQAMYKAWLWLVVLTLHVGHAHPWQWGPWLRRPISRLQRNRSKRRAWLEEASHGRASVGERARRSSSVASPPPLLLAAGLREEGEEPPPLWPRRRSASAQIREPAIDELFSVVGEEDGGVEPSGSANASRRRKETRRVAPPPDPATRARRARRHQASPAVGSSSARRGGGGRRRRARLRIRHRELVRAAEMGSSPANMANERGRERERWLGREGERGERGRENKKDRGEEADSGSV